MQKSDENGLATLSPGVWSTDDYIRRWAKSLGMDGVCIIPLQSLHDDWKATIHFDKEGHPVERIAKMARTDVFGNEDRACHA